MAEQEVQDVNSAFVTCFCVIRHREPACTGLDRWPNYGSDFMLAVKHRAKTPLIYTEAFSQEKPSNKIQFGRTFFGRGGPFSLLFYARWGVGILKAWLDLSEGQGLLGAVVQESFAITQRQLIPGCHRRKR
ncbi:MAG: hypothetical protein ACRD8A_00235 [Candidatus Acidiferrales bacterium]